MEALEKEKVDVAGYVPVHPLAYYGSTNISSSGTSGACEQLTEDFKKLLKDIGEDLRLWNGSRGVLGRPYVATQEMRKSHVSVGKVSELRAKYTNLKRTLSSEKSFVSLKEKHNRLVEMQRSIENSVAELNIKREKNRKHIHLCNVADPQMHEKRKALVTSLLKIDKDLYRLKQATETLQDKILNTKALLSESETGFLPRYAILQCLCREATSMGRGNVGGRMTESFGNATSLEKRSMDATLAVLQAKRFYIDCKLGLARLYKVENALKSILENLEEAMNAQKGKPSSSTKNAFPSEISVDYRLSYVRRLWNAVNPYFKCAWPYVRYTSLRSVKTAPFSPGGQPEAAGFLADGTRYRDSVASIFGESKKSGLRKRDTINSVFGEAKTKTKGYGTFSSTSPILPSYSRIEIAYTVNLTKKIRALHDSAAVGYKFLNRIYDSQTKWIDAARESYKLREKEQLAACEKLITEWEHVFALSE